MKIITCVGYHYTGSGVIDDLLKECDNVAQCAIDAECRILQDSDGVSDLEYHLIENPHRLKTSFAIERFLHLAKEQRRMYEKIFGKKWLKICTEYIESISDFKYKGYQTRQLFLKYPLIKYIYKFIRLIRRFIPKSIKKPEGYNYFPFAFQYYAHPSQDIFLKKTQEFIDKLCGCIPNVENAEYVVLNQLLAGNNPERYLRYVNDIKVVVVDRDPRDLFIYLKLRNDSLYPHEPKQFCEIYKNIRPNNMNYRDDRILYMKFEDLIYKYDEKVKEVFKFIGIDKNHHICPKRFFDPQISIKGTKLWEKYPAFKEDVDVIEELLPEYLYDYNCIKVK